MIRTLLVECNPDDSTEVRDVQVEYMYYPADPETGSVEEYELVNWEAYTDHEYDNIIQQLCDMNAGQEDREEFMYMCKEEYE